MTVDANSSWWARHKKIIWLLIAVVLGASCIVFITCAYIFQLAWTGFSASQGPNVQQYQPTKTLWDWLQLFIVPVALSIAAYWLNRANRETEQRVAEQRNKTEHAIALDGQRATLLQDYLDRMSKLLLEQKFRNPQSHPDAQNIARAFTLTVLPRLNAERKGRLIQFLYESHLIDSNTKDYILLRNADLSKADLTGFNLNGINLSEANLSEANLSGTNLSEAQLQGTCLRSANLSGAILRNANLYKADLCEATLNGALLQEAILIQADLSDAWLARTDATRANFSDALVNGAKFEDTILEGITISQAQLSNPSFATVS